MNDREPEVVQVFRDGELQRMKAGYRIVRYGRRKVGERIASS